MPPTLAVRREPPGSWVARTTKQNAKYTGQLALFRYKSRWHWASLDDRYSIAEHTAAGATLRFAASAHAWNFSRRVGPPTSLNHGGGDDAEKFFHFLRSALWADQLFARRSYK